jgi:non-ribosomal peptide synthetase-like protein
MRTQLARYFLLAFPASTVLIVLTALVSAGIRWSVLPRLQPGRFGGAQQYLLRQMAGQPHPGIEPERAARHLRHRVRAVLVPPAGRQGGRDAEISTALGVVPDMLTLGDETFIADAVMLGDEEIDGGWMTMQPTVISHRSFVGNGSYIPDGTVLPERVLIGVHTRAGQRADEERRHLAGLAADQPAGARADQRLSGMADLPPVAAAPPGPRPGRSVPHRRAARAGDRGRLHAGAGRDAGAGAGRWGEVVWDLAWPAWPTASATTCSWCC